MSMNRLLIVDDDVALLRALTRALELRMPEVIVDKCDSGLGACGKLAEADYDAVITDIKMPGMDGLTLLAQIREQYPEIPTLLITGHGQHDLAVQALRGGAFDFIQKPVDRDYLVASLNRAFQVRALAREVDRQRRKLEQHAEDLQRTVDERTRQLQEANGVKDRFLATLAHELRNPLAAIRAAVDVLTLTSDNSPHREQVEETISNQVRHMVHLLDDLLDISRITQDRITLQRQPIDFLNVVNSAVESMRPAIEQRRHRCTLRLPENPLPVNGDETRLHQVVVNLLTNAVKYTQPEGDISLSVQQQDASVVLRIRDSGIGIAPEMLPRVFEPFMQVEDSRPHCQGGLGIGLTLVRRLVELHGGSVAVASDGVGRGSVFTVRLPMCSEFVEEMSEPEFDVNVPSLKVLLVEDNCQIASFTEKLLTNCGHQVVSVAPDGPSALQAAEHNDIDVILLDIGLPGMNGYEVALRLRQLPRLSNTLIIALTGYGQPEDRDRSREVGCNHHLVKPVSVQTLQRVFSEHAPCCKHSA